MPAAGWASLAAQVQVIKASLGCCSWAVLGEGLGRALVEARGFDHEVGKSKSQGASLGDGERL